MSRFVMLVAIVLLLLSVSGCGGSPASIVAPPQPPAPSPPSLAMSGFAIEETRVGYGNLPGGGTYFEYSYRFTGQVVNTGGPGEFKIVVHAKQVNVVNPPWEYLTQFGPGTILASSVYPIDEHCDTGTQGYWRFKLELYAMQSGSWALVQTVQVDST